MSVFKWTAAEASAAVSTGSMMLVVVLEASGHEDLLESDTARTALSTLPIRALRLRNGTADYTNFTAFFPSLTPISAALVGPNGTILTHITDSLNEDTIISAINETTQKQAQQAVNAMMSQMGGASNPNPPPSGSVTTITSVSELDALNAKDDSLVVVYFSAKWCGPCRGIAAEYDALPASHPGARFAKVDIDEAKELAETHSVTSIPTFIFFKSGRVVAQSQGADLSKVKAVIQQHSGEDVKINWDAPDEVVEPTVPSEPVSAASEKPHVEVDREKLAKDREERKKRMTEKVEQQRIQREREEREENEKRTNRMRVHKPAPKKKHVDPEPTPPTPQPKPKAKTPEKVETAPAARPPRTYTEARLSIRLLNGTNTRETFPATATLNDVREKLAHSEAGRYLFTTTFPKRRFATTEEMISLADCDLVPSGTLILQSVEADLAKKHISNAGVSSAVPSLLGSITSMLNPMSWFATPSTEPAQSTQPPLAPPPQSATRPQSQEAFGLHSRDKKDKKDDKDENRDNGNGTAFEY